MCESLEIITTDRNGCRVGNGRAIDPRDDAAVLLGVRYGTCNIVAYFVVIDVERCDDRASIINASKRTGARHGCSTDDIVVDIHHPNLCNSGNAEKIGIGGANGNIRQ